MKETVGNLKPMTMKFPFKIILLILCLGCQDRDETFIDPSLQGLVDSFVYEGAIRGKKINPTGFFIHFEEGLLQRTGGVGATIFNNKKQDQILFDLEYFNQYPDRLEWVFFHEGGHAWLGRDHAQQKLSVMNTTLQQDFDQYGEPFNREYFLDELFK